MADRRTSKGVRPGAHGKGIVGKDPGPRDKTPMDTGIGVMLKYRDSFRYGHETNRNRPKHTLEMAMAIERAVGLGLTQQQISYLTGLKPVTLREHYRQELDMGGATLQLAISSNVAAIALDLEDKRCLDAAKFILERKFGWKQATEVDMKGGVQITQNVLDIRSMEPEDRGNLKALLLQALGTQPALEDGTTIEAEYEDVEPDSAEDLL